MHSKALLVQDFTNLVYIWHKHDRTHLFAIVICFSFIFKFLKLKLDLKMAAPLEARQKQRAVIEFLVAEGETSLKIHNRLKNVYKDNTIDYSNVKRWVQRFKKVLKTMKRWVKPAQPIGYVEWSPINLCQSWQNLCWWVDKNWQAHYCRGAGIQAWCKHRQCPFNRGVPWVFISVFPLGVQTADGGPQDWKSSLLHSASGTPPGRPYVYGKNHYCRWNMGIAFWTWI